MDATVLVVFFAPLLYAMMQRISEWRGSSQKTDSAADILVKKKSYQGMFALKNCGLVVKWTGKDGLSISR